MFQVLLACSEYGIDKANEPAETPHETSAPEPTTTPPDRRPEIEVDPTLLDFGTPDPGEDVDRSFTIRNLGDAALTLEPMIFDDPVSGFVMIADPGASSLDPGATTVVEVRFTGDGFAEENTLHVISDDPASPDVPVSLVASGVPPLLVLEPETLDFGRLPVGCTAEGTVTARNLGTIAVEITSVDVFGSGFTLDEPALPIVLGAGSTWPFAITFTAGSGADAAVLAVDSDGGGPTADLLGEGGALEAIDVFEATEPAPAAVYFADETLYAWDPVTHATTTIGRLGTLMWDIAIDFDGVLLGLDEGGTIYRIDPLTASTTVWLRSTAGNALTVLPDNRIILASGSNVYEVDRATGATTRVMTYGGTSSGDITEAAGDLYWTIAGGGSDSLVHIDPATWSVVGSGSTGESSLYGLAWPNGELWSFSAAGRAYRHDMASGAVLEEAALGGSAYGATHNPRYGVAGTWTFRLSQDAVEVSLVVTVDGALRADWTYDATLNAVVFAPAALAGGETVEVTYETLGGC